MHNPVLAPFILLILEMTSAALSHSLLTGSRFITTTTTTKTITVTTITRVEMCLVALTIFKLTTYNGGASKNAIPFNSVPVHLCKIILGPEAISKWP